MQFYKAKEMEKDFKLNETILEASIYMDDKELFKYIIENYSGELPQICLQSLIFDKNEILTEMLLTHFVEKFKNPELYKEIIDIPSEFTKIIDKDALECFTNLDKISHPVFSDPGKLKAYVAYDPLQMAVHFNISRLVKLILENT